MNSQIFHRTILSILLLVAVLRLNAQPTPEVKASVDRDSILIGEPIRLILEADIPENAPIRFFPVDTIPHFEFLDRGKIDTTNTSEGTFLRRVMVITSFDSGHWIIPQLTLGDGIVTDSIPVDVGYSAFDRTQDYHDIKDILDVEAEEKKTPWWWYAIGAALLLLLIIFIIVLRRKKPKVAIVEVPIDPYAEAMSELMKLRTAQVDQKQYYSGLVDIFRLYISRSKGMYSLQKTTDDLVIQLKGLGMQKETFEKLSQSLRLSDYVKFAKYVPGKEDDLFAFESIKKSIEEIDQIK